MAKLTESLKGRTKVKLLLTQLIMNGIQQLITPNLINTFQQLSASLKAIQPISTTTNQTTPLITYALVATAVVVIFVYHYIKQNQKND
jgi:type II secretory pathway component PulF